MIEETIAVVEGSQTIIEAATKLGLDRTTLYHRLRVAGYKIIRDTKLKVVKK